MRLIVIAGMHRSGTSFVAELVHALGAEVGDGLLEPADDNPHGFFEREDVKRLNDLVLKRLGGTWERPPTGLSKSWQNSGGFDRLRASAEALLKELFDSATGAETYVLKDPRFSLTAPFWNSIVSIDASVLPLRDPREVAQSLRHRNGMAPARSAALWLRYTIDAILALPNLHIIGLHELHTDPHVEVPRLASMLQLESQTDRALSIAAERTRTWTPAAPFSSLTNEPQLQVATAFFEILKREAAEVVRPILEALGNEWRSQPMADLANEASSTNKRIAEAASERIARLQQQLEDIHIRMVDLKEDRDQAHRELRTVSVRASEADKLREEQLAAARKQLDRLDRQVDDERTRRTKAEQQARDEQSRRTKAEQQARDEQTRRTKAEQQARDEQSRRTKAEQQARDEQSRRTKAESHRDRELDHARQVERELSRLKARRGVRVALTASRPFRPVFRTARRIRSLRPGTSDHDSEGAKGAPAQQETETVEADRAEELRQATRNRLRRHLVDQPRIAETTVSIIMPTFNRAQKIARAVDSILAQTHSAWELLIIDDGSDDATFEVLEPYLQDARVRYEWQQRGGVSRARNRGLDLATGDLIAFLDTDNIWDPDFLSLMIAQLDLDSADIAYSALRLQQNGSTVMLRGEPFDSNKLIRGNYIDLNVLCHLRSFTDDGLRFDTELRRTVDWDYVLALTRTGSVTYSNFVGATYTLHEDTDQISVREPYLYRKLVATRHQLINTSSSEHATDVRSLFRHQTLNIAICLAAPQLKRAEWGDYHFGVGLGQALERRGHKTCLYYFEEAVGADHDVMISLRGLTGHAKPPGVLHVIWSISHPDLLEWGDIERADLFLTASSTWSKMLRWALPKHHHVLPQATDRARFYPHASGSEGRAEVLFVGNSRNADRPIVTAAVAAGIPFSIYGTRWAGRVPDQLIKGEHIPNERLSDHYAAARLVLNDHWDSMRDFGYVSNRVFDVIASGGRVLSDHLPAVQQLFGDWVSTVRRDESMSDELAKMVALEPDGGNDAATWTLEHHTFDNRVDSLLAHIEEHLASEKVYSNVVGAQSECPCYRPGRESASETCPDDRDQRRVRTRGSIERLRVAFAPQFSERGLTSSAYIRIVQPLTSEIDDVDIDLFRVPTGSQHASPRQALAEADALIVSRTAFADQATADQWLDAAESLSLPLVLDLDDAFHLMDDSHPEYEIYQERIGPLESVLARSNEIWCSTPLLADSMGATDADIVVIPNSIDPRLWRRYRALEDRPQRDGTYDLELLYSGTATHGPDLQLVIPALDEISKDVSLRLSVVGVAPSLPDRPWIRRLSLHEARSYPRYATAIRDLAPLFDLGIAPLVDNRFNQLKSDIKILEYLALGLVPLASEVGPYRASSELVVGGLSPDQATWQKRIEDLARNPDALASARDSVASAREVLWQTRNSAATGKILAQRLVAMTATW